MIVKFKHIETQLEAAIDNVDGSLNISGDNNLIKGIKSFCSMYENSFFLPGAVKAAQASFDGMLLDQKTVSVNVACDKFITDIMIPAFINMGYECTIQSE